MHFLASLEVRIEGITFQQFIAHLVGQQVHIFLQMVVHLLALGIRNAFNGVLQYVLVGELKVVMLINEFAILRYYNQFGNQVQAFFDVFGRQ